MKRFFTAHRTLNVSLTSVINRHKRANHHRSSNFQFNFHRCAILELSASCHGVDDDDECHVERAAKQHASYHPKHIIWMTDYECLENAFYRAQQQIIWHWINAARHQQQSINGKSFPSRLSERLQMIRTWLSIQFSDHKSVNNWVSLLLLFLLCSINQWNKFCVSESRFSFVPNRVTEWRETSFWDRRGWKHQFRQ